MRIRHLASASHQRLNGADAVVVGVNPLEARGYRVKPLGVPQHAAVIAVHSDKLVSVRPPHHGWMFVLSGSRPEHNGTRVLVTKFDVDALMYEVETADGVKMKLIHEALVQERPAQSEPRPARKRLRESSVAAGVCVACMTEPASHMALRCRHLCLCESCVTNFQDRRPCPVCRDGVHENGAAHYGKIYVAMP